MPKIGPFFYIKEKLIFDAIDLSKGSLRANKLDNDLGHEQLYDRYYRLGYYEDFPRGRVIWDNAENRAIIYIDHCLNRQEIIEIIRAAFELDAFVILSDEHYQCKECLGKYWKLDFSTHS